MTLCVSSFGSTKRQKRSFRFHQNFSKYYFLIKMKIDIRTKKKLIPLAANTILALTNLYCLLVYYSNVADKDLMHVAYIAYITMMANGFIGITAFNEDESFGDLRVLLDYANVVLPLPCITTEMWLKYSVGPKELAMAHSCFGLAAFFFFVLMEYKRQDLTDLALLINIISLIVVGASFGNYAALAAALIVTLAYFTSKRHEECVGEHTKDKGVVFHYAMVTFSLVTLVAFDPSNWVPNI